nr:MAG: hypothetical protein DIU74_00185 [Pseudomonadota bacterium]
MAPPLPSPNTAVHESTCLSCGHTLRMRVHRPEGSTPPVVLYFHPGRFVVDAPEESETVARMLTARFGVATVTPFYSLAAERPFPAAAEDAYAALRWVHDNAGRGLWNARRIALIGAEAGGNLAAVAAMMARDRGGPCVKAQVLCSPMLDPSLGSCSMREAEAESRACGEGYQSYLQHAADRLHPYAAPILCTRLQGLPPALLLTAPDDPMRDETRDYAERLRAAGVTAQVVQLATPGWSEQTWQAIGDFLLPLLAPARGSARPSSSTI